jgi:ABC-type protease/lipase transport system fused ATPase/permease subunit
MAKFTVNATEFVERSVVYTVSVTQKEVVAALGLEDEDKKNWKERVQEYLEMEWEAIRARDSTVLDTDSIEEIVINQTDFDNVEEAE